MFRGKELAFLELKVGVEPTTCGLRNRCSTTELLQHFLLHIWNIEKKC